MPLLSHTSATSRSQMDAGHQENQEQPDPRGHKQPRQLSLASRWALPTPPIATGTAWASNAHSRASSPAPGNAWAPHRQSWDSQTHNRPSSALPDPNNTQRSLTSTDRHFPRRHRRHRGPECGADVRGPRPSHAAGAAGSCAGGAELRETGGASGRGGAPLEGAGLPWRGGAPSGAAPQAVEAGGSSVGP